MACRKKWAKTTNKLPCHLLLKRPRHCLLNGCGTGVHTVLVHNLKFNVWCKVFQQAKWAWEKWLKWNEKEQVKQRVRKIQGLPGNFWLGSQGQRASRASSQSRKKSCRPTRWWSSCPTSPAWWPPWSSRCRRRSCARTRRPRWRGRRAPGTAGRWTLSRPSWRPCPAGCWDCWRWWPWSCCWRRPSTPQGQASSLLM